jgi:hypothetical protein
MMHTINTVWYLSYSEAKSTMQVKEIEHKKLNCTLMCKYLICPYPPSEEILHIGFEWMNQIITRMKNVLKITSFLIFHVHLQESNMCLPE